MKHLFHFLTTCRRGLLLLLLGCLAGITALAQAPAWQTVMPLNTSVNATATSPSGDIFIAGSFFNTINFGATTLTDAGGKDIFVAKSLLKISKSLCYAMPFAASNGTIVEAVLLSKL